MLSYLQNDKMPRWTTVSYEAAAETYKAGMRGFIFQKLYVG